MSNPMIKVFVQATAGSCEKMLCDEKALEFIETTKVSHPYPYSYGFVLSTTAADGDNVDCYVVSRKELEPGTIMCCEVVGLLDQIESGEPDHKVLAVFAGEMAVLPSGALETLQNFIYAVFAKYPGSAVRVGPIHSREVALRYIRDCLDG